MFLFWFEVVLLWPGLLFVVLLLSWCLALPKRSLKSVLCFGTSG